MEVRGQLCGWVLFHHYVYYRDCTRIIIVYVCTHVEVREQLCGSVLFHHYVDYRDCTGVIRLA